MWSHWVTNDCLCSRLLVMLVMTPCPCNGTGLCNRGRTSIAPSGEPDFSSLEMLLIPIFFPLCINFNPSLVSMTGMEVWHRKYAEIQWRAGFSPRHSRPPPVSAAEMLVGAATQAGDGVATCSQSHGATVLRCPSIVSASPPILSGRNEENKRGRGGGDGRICPNNPPKGSAMMNKHRKPRGPRCGAAAE